MAERDETARNKLIVQVVGIIALVFVAYLDGPTDFDVNPITYWIIGGVILGVSDLKALLGGFHFDGNNKKDK